MCGVCGIVSLDSRLERDGLGARVSAMAHSLAHRGPEQVHLEAEPAATFGATRLAIRGLIGRQPYLDPQTGVIAVCNGEIDNHRELRSWLEAQGRPVAEDTDVAVIPGLYLELGEAFVERMVGVFALAVWDPRVDRLILARDRAGERPLFYALRNDSVLFATEVAALALDPSMAPDNEDGEAIGQFLATGSFKAPTSPLRGIRKVAPAEIVTVTSDAVRRRRYWRWQVVTRPKRMAHLDAFDRTFRQAVERQSEIDTEYGVFLSGGLDSSLVAAVLRRVRPDIRPRAFTLRFSEKSYDEGRFAEQVARHLGIESTTICVGAHDFPAMLEALVRTTGEPLADPAWVPTSLLAQRARKDVKLAFVGEGADELFGGYPTYLGVGAAKAYAALPRPLRRLVAAVIRRLPQSDRKVTVPFLLQRFLAGTELDGLARHRLWTASLDADLRRRLGLSVSPEVSSDADGGKILDLVQRHDLETSLAEGLLTKSDRASMNWALELRSPYLDRDVMEFAATLPVRQRVRRLETKVFLKRYAERYLPRSIIYRTKRGLSVPLSSWLRGPLRDWAAERLGSKHMAAFGIRRQAVMELFSEHLDRRADHARALWTLIVLSQWLDWNARRKESVLGIEPAR